MLNIKLLKYSTKLFCFNSVSHNFIKLNRFLTTNKAFITNIQSNSKIEAVFKDNEVQINWHSLDQNLVSKKFPYIWLRDNCKCSKCYNYVADEVEIDLQKISDNIKPSDVVALDSTNLKITWNDGHSSEFNLRRLADYASKHHHKAYYENDRKLLWNNEMISKIGIKSFDYKKYLTDDSILRASLQSIKKYGAAIIEGVPANEKEIIKVCQRIGPIQNSHFGADCLVTNSLSFKDRAYTNLALKAHTDTAYLKNTAGVEMFHVIKRPIKGGQSLLVDGFNCAKQLREQQKEDFETLSKLKVEIQFFKEGSYDLRQTDSIINLDPITKDLFQIRYNPYHKTNVTHLSYDEMIKYYKAIKNFSKIIQDPKNEYWFGLREDQVLLFDNFRLLHGRGSFEGNRTLVTIYISRDDWLSKASVLDA